MSPDRTEPADRGGTPLPPRLDPRAGRPARRQGQQPPAGGDGDGTAPRRPRLRWTAALRGVAAVLAAVVLATSGWGWYLGRVAEASVQRTDAIPTDGNDETVTTGAAMNLLLVGNDSRADLTEEQLAQLHAGEEAGTNTDTMILVHLPADGTKASFVSFPRDSYVQIPGYGWDKLNAAYAYGRQEAPENASEETKAAQGAQLLVQTISGLTGLQIDHYAEVDLLGFFELSSVVGGVEVNLCAAVDDRRWSGAFFPAGVQTISGAEAVKFVRQRHNISDRDSDFDRITRQQVFIAGVLRKVLSEDVLLDLGKQRELVEAVGASMTIDQDLHLMDLAQQMQSIDVRNIGFQTVPYVGDDEDDAGRYILRLADEESLRDFFADLSAEPEPPAGEAVEAPPTAAPGNVPVAVYNGSGVPGLAAGAAEELVSAGFPVTGTANADSSDYDTTEVRYAAGDEGLAAAVAAVVPGARLVAGDEVAAGAVELIIGGDFTAVGRPVDVAAPAAPVAGEEARTAADTSCIN